MKFDSRRVEKAKGYLEFIWPIDPSRPKGTTPQAIAYIRDFYRGKQTKHFWGFYGIHEVKGETVAAVKEELFSLIEAGQ